MRLKKMGLPALLLCSLRVFSQEGFPAEEIPAALKNRANAVIRKMERTVDMRANDNVILNIKKTVTILNKNGDEEAEMVLPYNKNNTIKYVKGVILNAFGKATSKFSLSNFTDHSAVSDFSLFEDDRVKHYAPNVLSYPYTLVCEYEVRSKQNLAIPDWYAGLDAGVAVAHSSYTFICKPEDKVRIKAYNYIGNPELSTTDKFKSQTWTVKNIPAFKPEPYAPDPDNYRTHIKIAPEEFNFYGYKGKYQNWDELGKWIYTELVKDRQTLTPAAVEEVKALVAGIENDKDKARKIYAYVQQKTRYISVQIGIGGNRPMPAAEVHQLSYGDCKALVNYTQSLLKAVGIPSWYCVVNAGDFKKNMETDFASMNQGNHIILCLPLKNDTTWLECTNQEIPFGFLGSFTDDRTVLACTGEAGKILKTPALTTPMNLQHRRAELSLDKEGNISGKLQTTFAGSQYDNCERMINQPLTEQLKMLKRTYDIDNINFSELKYQQDKGSKPITTESFDLSIQKYAAQTNNHLYLVLNAFNKKRSVPEVRNRKLPLFINRGYTDVDELIYHLPENINIELSPDDKVLKTEFGTYELHIKKEDKKLTYNRKFILNDGTYPAEKYADFADFISKVSSADQVKAIFKLDSAQK
ncbi:DUF3857 domain-containing transglutaminase family protein [Pedobacter heparinus]|uniref:DUF3857 domain-containing transglutaminase family protein n=1 Tax=Pedobacter heparinus TaxID=984 RepID=UPI00292E92D7|nr:DUF3857 domain-containing transglutaminase family protein [Pedobacter heparinus]